MAQTLTRILMHIVFSTKNREPMITAAIEPDLHAYMGGISRGCESPMLAVGGVEDHVHLLVSMSKNIALAELVMQIKKDSSKRVKGRDSALRGFGWQDGYAGFSIGASQVPRVRGYIAKQKEHHRKMSYKEELVILCKRYGVEYDERFMLG